MSSSQSQPMSHSKLKKLIVLGLFAAIAFVATALLRIPMISFLKYDPKDIIIVICGFIMGPSAALLVSAIVSLIEMVTVSTTGFWGLVMNILSTCSFACTASFIYKKKRTLSGAITGLAVGCAVMIVMMLAWNYLVTPIYQGVPREAVAAMLIPVFLPFNALKGSINAAMTLIIYKPVSVALSKAGFLRISDNVKNGKLNIEVLSASVLILLTSVLIILAMKGII